MTRARIQSNSPLYQQIIAQARLHHSLFLAAFTAVWYYLIAASLPGSLARRSMNKSDMAHCGCQIDNTNREIERQSRESDKGHRKAEY
jgi:hypothetical protein